MREETKPWLCSLAYVALYAKGAIDAGHERDVTVREIADSIEQGTLLDVLLRKVAYRWDFSLFNAGNRQEACLLAALNAVARGLRNREQRNLPQRTGLRFLMFLLLAAIDQGYWTL